MIFFCLKYFVLVLICIVSRGLVDSSRQNIQASTSKKHILAAATGTGVNPWFCQADLDCEKLNPDCLTCTYEKNCVYGNKTIGNCSVPQQSSQQSLCKGKREFQIELDCLYCYQLPVEQYTCEPRGFCQATSSLQERQIVNCTVAGPLHCLGKRKFLKSFRCNWTSGYRWSTSLLLSITVGGFGVDRFYLGHWEAGLGKLFSFGGLGVWTLVDIVLVATGYITPADGSLYIF